MSDNIADRIIRVQFQMYKPPVFKEAKPDDIIIYGENANKPFPDYLYGLYEQSPNHKAAIDAKVRFTSGGGWTVDTRVMNLADKALYEGKINEINQLGESLNDVTTKWDLDYENTGAFAIEVIYNANRTKWAQLNYIPISRIRAYKTIDGKLRYVHLNDWRSVTKYKAAKEFGDKRDFKEWAPFGTEKKPAESELLYYKTFRPIKSGESDVYALPPFSGAIPWIELDIRTGVFHLNNIRNNFTAGTVLNFFNGDPSPEQKEQIEKDIKAKFSGDNSEDTGGIMLVFNKPGTTGVTVEKLNAGDMDKMYLQVAEFARQGIFTSHHIISPTLMGISTPGALGQRQEMQDAYELMDSTYCKPTRAIFERVINRLMKFNGMKPLYKLQDVKPFGMTFSEDTIKAVLPANVLQKLVADTLGIDIAAEQQKLSFSSADKPNPFDEIGEVVDPENIIGVFPVNFDDNGRPTNKDSDFKTMHFAKVLSVDLTGIDGDILSLIRSNPKVSTEEIATALSESAGTISERITALMDAGTLIGEIGNMKISKAGAETLDEQDVALDIQIRYRYSGPYDSRNRDWCHKMMERSRAGMVYSREQIDSIAPSPEAPGGSPWFWRGGFCRRPDGTTTPYCRHNWEAVAVKTKR